MSGLFRYRSGERIYAYRVEELPCEFYVKRGVKVGDWAVLNPDGTLFKYMRNDVFLRIFTPDDREAEAAFVNAAFEKSLPGG